MTVPEMKIIIGGDSSEARAAIQSAGVDIDRLKARVEAARQAFAESDRLNLANSVEAARALAAQMDSMRNRVMAARQAFAEASEIKAFGDQLKSLGVGTAGLSLTTKEFGALTDKLAGLDAGLGRISPTLANAASGAVSFGKTAAVALGGIAAGAVLAQQGFEKVFGSTMRTADAVHTLSQRTGIGTDALQRLGFAASQNEASMEAVGQGMKFLAKNMAQAANGSKEAQESFARMGINIRDAAGNLKTTEQVFYEVADAMSMTADGGQRTAMAMQVLGRGGVELVPLLSQGSRAIRNLGDEAQRIGAVMSGPAIQAIDNFRDTVRAFEESGNRLKSTILQSILPSMTDWIGGFLDIISAGKRGEEAIAQFWDTLISGAANLTPVTLLLKQFGFFSDHLDEATASAEGLADQLQTVAQRRAELDKTATGYINRQLIINANRSMVSIEEAKKNLGELVSFAQKEAPKMLDAIEEARVNLFREAEATAAKEVKEQAEARKKLIKANIEGFLETEKLNLADKLFQMGKQLAQAQAAGFKDEAKSAKAAMLSVVRDQMQAIRDAVEGDGELQRTVRIKQYTELLKLAQEHGVATRDIERAIAAERKAIRADDARDAEQQERGAGAGRVRAVQETGQAIANAERAAGRERANAIREAAELAAEAKIGGEISGGPKGAGAEAGAGIGAGAGAEAGAGPLSDAALAARKRAAELEANRLRNAAKTDAERAAAAAAQAKAAGLAKEVEARKAAGKQEGKVDAELAAARKKASEAQLEANRKLNEAKKTGAEADKRAAEAAIQAAKAAQKAADELAAAQKGAGDAGKKAGDEAADGMGKAKEATEDAAGAAAGGKGGGGGGGGGPKPLKESLEDAEKAKEDLVEDVVEEMPKAKEKIKETGEAAGELAESLGKAGKATGGGGGGGDQITIPHAGGVSMGDGATAETPGGGGGGAANPIQTIGGETGYFDDSGRWHTIGQAGSQIGIGTQGGTPRPTKSGGGGGGGGGYLSGPTKAAVTQQVADTMQRLGITTVAGVSGKLAGQILSGSIGVNQAKWQHGITAETITAMRQWWARAEAQTVTAAAPMATISSAVAPTQTAAQTAVSARTRATASGPASTTIHAATGIVIKTPSTAIESATVVVKDTRTSDRTAARKAAAEAAEAAAADRAKFAGQLATTGKAESISAELARGRAVTKIDRMTIQPVIQVTTPVDVDRLGEQLGQRLGRAFVTEIRKPDRSPI